MSLEEIGKANFTEKVGHGYLPIYESLWKDIKDKPITLLEIGIYNGNSLRTWCEWFPNATIVGIDSNPSNPMKTDRAELHFGNQADEDFIKEIGNKYGEFDIVIDDAGHMWDEQQIGFTLLWPFVKPGGMYIIEDLHTSVDVFWKGQASIDTLEFLKRKLNDVVLNQVSDMKTIEFYNKLAILHKRE